MRLIKKYSSIVIEKYKVEMVALDIIPNRISTGMQSFVFSVNPLQQ
jgi:hypothetical protein